MRKILLILSLSCLASSSIAQQVSTSSVDSIFSEWNKTDVPGGAIAVIHQGNIVYSNGYGLADLEHDVPITPSTVFYIGSVSKQFVTFSILLLEEQGKLDLDDEVQEYLPDFPRYERPLTIRHFIHHTSGVRDYLTLMDLKGRSYLDHIETQEAYELIKNQKELNFTPGERYLYSNSCYLMLAMIAEKASGMSMKEFAEKEIFGPLGMEKSRFYDDITGLIKDRAFSYSNNGEGFDNLVSRFDLVGSGGVYSTVEDLYLWDQNFYKNTLGEGNQALIDTMLTDGVLDNGESSGYAFALVNGTYRGLKTMSHSGALAGYRAYYVRFPEQQLSVIILSNRDDAAPADKAYRVADLYLGNQLKAESEYDGVDNEDSNPPEKTPAINLTPAELETYTGTYYSKELNVTYDLFTEEDLFKRKIGFNTPTELNPSSEDRFTANYTTYRFERDPNGQITGFRLDAGRVTNLKFVKQASISP